MLVLISQSSFGGFVADTMGDDSHFFIRSFISRDFLSFAYSFLCEVLGATILKGVMTFRYLCPRANCVSPWCHEKLRREGGSERRQCHFLTRSTTTPTPLRQYKRREQATCLPPYTIPTQQYS